MNVLVYGATGSQQFPVLKALSKRGAQPFAITRSESNVGLLESAGAKAVLADLNDLARLEAISEGMDAVSLLIPFFVPDPSIAMTYARNMIDAAVRAGVKLIVWNTSGFIPAQRTGNPAIDLRITVREYLRDAKVPHVILQPSVYAENLLGPWTAPYVREEGVVAYPTPAEMRIGWIATEDVAEFMAAAIFHPGVSGKSYQLSGMENPDGNELAEQFSLALNRRIGYYAMPPKEFGEILDTAFGPGAGKGAEEMYQHIADTKQFPVLYNERMSDVLNDLPVKMTPIRDWVSGRQEFTPNTQ